MVSGNIFNVLDQKIVLDAGPGDTHGIHFLERIASDNGGRNLPRNYYHRDRIHISGGNSGDRIGGAPVRKSPGRLRACRWILHSHPRHGVAPCSCRTRICLTLSCLNKASVKVQDRPARVSKEILNAFVLKALYYNICSVELHNQ